MSTTFSFKAGDVLPSWLLHFEDEAGQKFDATLGADVSVEVRSDGITRVTQVGPITGSGVICISSNGARGSLKPHPCGTLEVDISPTQRTFMSGESR